MKTELLAPAKNIEIAKAAIDCGADAVYIGSIAYGARINASNSLEDIKELVGYAHKFYVKVYVTLNTIISDNEIEEVKSIINKLYDIGVDALIVQDMAILEMSIKDEIPPILLHISTQCNNRNIKNFKFFNDIGISRVVSARELSLEQLRQIKTQLQNLEIETFIHGALCVSYSGQCYLSHFIGGRSANKGECAQPCRKKYSLVDDKGNVLVQDKHLLCLKDFNTSKYIKDLVDIGIESYKIEGRLKDKNYVMNIVSHYRILLDKYSEKTSSGKIFLDFEPDINKTFNRGYTDYFLNGKTKCFNFSSPKFIGQKIGQIISVSNKYFTVKLDKNIILNNQDGLCFNLSGDKGCLVNKIEGNKIFPNKMPDIKVGDIVYRNIDFSFEQQLSCSNNKRKIEVNVKVKENKIIFTDEDNNSVDISIIEVEKPNNIDKMKDNFIKNISKMGNSDFYMNNIELLQVLPFIKISNINEYRRILLDKLMSKRLDNYKIIRQNKLKYSDYYIKDLDYRANVHNNKAKEFYEHCNSCVNEFSFESNKPNRQVELMRTKHCIKYAMDKCKAPINLFLVDEKGVKLPLKFDCKNCEMVVLSPQK